MTDISWKRINHPSEAIQIGDTIKVQVIRFNSDTQRISLGMKQLEPDPWVAIAEKYKVGQIVSVKVSRIVSFGVFVRIEENLEGLVHISELSDQRITSIETIVKMGDKIEAKRIAKKYGLPVIEGSEGGVSNINEAKKIIKNIGFPVLIKAAGGGAVSYTHLTLPTKA